jgi:hypothetical protein
LRTASRICGTAATEPTEAIAIGAADAAGVAGARLDALLELLELLEFALLDVLPAAVLATMVDCMFVAAGGVPAEAALVVELPSPPQPDKITADKIAPNFASGYKCRFIGISRRN